MKIGLFLTLLFSATLVLSGSAAEPAAEGCTSCGMKLTVRRTTSNVSEVENSYLLPNVTILLGDTVTWTNNGMVPHTTTSDAGLWDSGTMFPGKTFSHTFKSAGIFAYGCSFHKQMGMRGKIIVLPPAPQITSALAFSGAADLPFYYAITATNSPGTFTADNLPPGLVLNGNVISGIPTDTGAFSVSLSAGSASGSDSKRLALQIIAATPELDSDGDGFSDALETLTGSSPSDPSSTPYGIPSAALTPLSVSKLSLSLNYIKPGSDSLKVTGILNSTKPPAFTNTTVALDFGGVVKQFSLDATGSAKVGNDAVSFATKSKNGSTVTAFSISLSGDFAATLAQVGLDASVDQKAVPKAVSLTILCGGIQFQKTQIISYSSKTAKSGMAR